MEIQELVAAPISLSVETVIDGTKFYSSENLKKKFILAFEKSSKGKHISSEMQKLVSDNLVMPCYKSKNLFGFIKRKLTNSPDKYILGFYHIENKRVVVLVENSLSIFGTAANNELVSTTMHECMHMVAGRNLNKFLSVFKNYLRAYYTEFYKDYFKIENLPKNTLDTILGFISVFERKGLNNVNRELSNYFTVLRENLQGLSSLSQEDFTNRLTQMIVALKLFVTHMQTLFKNYRNFSMLFTSLNQAYFNAFGEKNKYTTPIQELISLSEVACVLAEMRSNDPVIRKLFQIIA